MRLRAGSTRTSRIESERPGPLSERRSEPSTSVVEGLREQRPARHERGSRGFVDARVGVVHRPAELPVAVADPEHERDQCAEDGQREHAPRAQPPARGPRRAPRGRARRRPRRSRGRGRGLLLAGQHDHAGAAARRACGRRRPARRWRSGRLGGRYDGARRRLLGRRRRLACGVRSRALLDGISGVAAPAAVPPVRPLGVVAGHGGTLTASAARSIVSSC